MAQRAAPHDCNTYACRYQHHPEQFDVYSRVPDQLPSGDERQATAEQYLAESRLTVKEQKEQLMAAKWSNDGWRVYNNAPPSKQDELLVGVKLPIASQQLSRESYAYHKSDTDFLHPVSVQDPEDRRRKQEETQRQHGRRDSQVLTEDQRLALHYEVHGRRTDCGCLINKQKWEIHNKSHANRIDCGCFTDIKREAPPASTLKLAPKAPTMQNYAKPSPGAAPASTVTMTTKAPTMQNYARPSPGPAEAMQKADRSSRRASAQLPTLLPKPPNVRDVSGGSTVTVTAPSGGGGARDSASPEREVDERRR